jgi:PAS domain S-box-containing protein
MMKRTFSLQTLLIIPFVLQVLGITGLVGYLSYRSGQRAVEKLAHQVMEKTSSLVTHDLNSYLQSAHRINQSHIAALRSGAITINNLDSLHRYITLQLFENQAVTSLLYGNPQGDFRFINRVRPSDFGRNASLQAGDLPYEAGVATAASPSVVNIYTVDENGNELRRVETIAKVDVRERPWYQQAVEQGKPGWSKPFQIGRSEVLAINAYAPFYNQDQQLQGVFSVNISLRRLDDFLSSLSISENGHAFIVDRDGLIIANSLEQPAYQATALPSSSASRTYQPGLIAFQRISALESSHPVIQHVGQQLENHFGNLKSIQSPQNIVFEVDGETHFLRVVPYQDNYGLDWLIVTGIPEAEFLGIIQDNARNTLLLCSLALAGAIGGGIWTARRLARSLQKLTHATQNVADGQLDQPLQSSSIQEIETLSEAFRQMVIALRQGEELRQNYETDLKQQVAEKTAALNEAQRIAHLGSWTFDLVSQKIGWSAEQFYIFGLDPSQPEPSYENYLQYLHPDDRGAMQTAIARAIATGEPYTIEHRVLRPDGDVRCVLGRGEAVKDSHGNVIKLIGTGLDITDRKMLEQALQASEQKTKEIFNSAIAAIASMRVFPDGTWDIDRVSAGCEFLTGFTPQELTDDNNLWIERIEPEDWQSFSPCSFDNIFAERTGTYEYRFRHKNGSLRWFSQTTNSTWSDTQQCWMVTATSTDITDRKLAEDQLMAEFRFRQAIEASIVEGITAVSLEGEQIYVNPAFCHMVGWSQEDLLGCSPPYRYWPPEEIDHITLALQNSLLGNRPPEGLELRFMRRNGERFDVMMLDAPLRDSQGNVIAWLASVYDITERKQADNALKESESRFWDISDSSPANIYVLVRRSDGTYYFEHISQAIETMCEVSVEAAMDDAKVLLGNIHPEDQAGYDAAVQQSLDRLEPFQHEWRVVTPSGKLKWLQGRSRPRYRDHGEVAWYGVVVDITDRKVTEAALRASENRYRAIFDQVTAGINQVDATGRFISVNTAFLRMLGYSEAEVLRLTYQELTHPEDIGNYQTAYQQLVTGEIPFFLSEKRYLHKAGHYVWTQVTISPLRDQDGNVESAVAVVVNIDDRKRAEMALQQSEAKFATVFHSNPAPAWIATLEEGLCLDFNASFKQFYGFQGKEKVSTTCRELGLWVNQTDRTYYFETLRQQSLLTNFETLFRTRTGEIKTVLLSASVNQINGQDCVIGVLNDITGRKQAELALQDSETRQRAILSALPDLVYIIGADGTILEQVTTKPELDLYPSHIDKTNLTVSDLSPPHLARRKLAAIRQALTTGDIQIFEQDVTLRDRIQHEELRVVPMPGDKVLLLVHDISDRKQAELALREKEERFRRAFDDAPISMALTTPEGRCFQVNQALCDFLGYTNQELLSLPIQALSHSEDMAKDEALMQQVLSGDLATFQLEKRYFHRQGHTVYGLLNVSLVRGSHQQPLYFVAQIQDISERRKVDQMKRDFVSIVSHELRTPLTSIRGALGILETGVLQNRPDKTKHMMTVAINNSDRLIRLVNNILDLARLESGKAPLVKEPCQVSELMTSAIDSLEAMAMEAQVSLKVTSLDRVIRLAPDAILQTLTNLLSNAIKFSAPGGTVWLSATEWEPDQAEPQASGHGATPEKIPLTPPSQAPESSSPFVLFSVKDEGRGIPPDKLQVIFTQFQQVDTSDSRQKGGTGLGLSICKNIVEQHGGSIWAESIPGQGSSFYFTLPDDPD